MARNRVFARIFVRGEDIGKNPVSEMVRGGEKPGLVFAKIFNGRRRYRKKPGF
jgi:hypothetical protein